MFCNGSNKRDVQRALFSFSKMVASCFTAANRLPIYEVAFGICLFKSANSTADFSFHLNFKLYNIFNLLACPALRGQKC